MNGNPPVENTVRIIPFTLGSIIIGLTIIAAGICDMLTLNIGNIIMAIGFVPGFIVIVYAMMKYNKGIF